MAAGPCGLYRTHGGGNGMRIPLMSSITRCVTAGAVVLFSSCRDATAPHLEVRPASSLSVSAPSGGVPLAEKLGAGASCAPLVSRLGTLGMTVLPLDGNTFRLSDAGCSDEDGDAGCIVSTGPLRAGMGPAPVGAAVQSASYAGPCENQYQSCIANCQTVHPGCTTAARQQRCLCFQRCMNYYSACLARRGG